MARHQPVLTNAIVTTLHISFPIFYPDLNKMLHGSQLDASHISAIYKEFNNPTVFNKTRESTFF
jgi:hypothetical protein